MVMVEETKKWQKRQDNKIFNSRCPKGLLAYKPSAFSNYLTGYPTKSGLIFLQNTEEELNEK